MERRNAAAAARVERFYREIGLADALERARDLAQTIDLRDSDRELVKA